MDRIYVTGIALSSSANTLQHLKEETMRISSACIQQITAQLSGIESNFRKDIVRYVEEVNALNEKIKMCVDENVSAITNRVMNLAEYEMHAYEYRNFG